MLLPLPNASNVHALAASYFRFCISALPAYTNPQSLACQLVATWPPRTLIEPILPITVPPSVRLVLSACTLAPAAGPWTGRSFAHHTATSCSNVWKLFMRSNSLVSKTLSYAPFTCNIRSPHIKKLSGSTAGIRSRARAHAAHTATSAADAAGLEKRASAHVVIGASLPSSPVAASKNERRPAGRAQARQARRHSLLATSSGQDRPQCWVC